MNSAEAAPWALVGLLVVFLALVLLLVHITRDEDRKDPPT